MRNIEGIYKVEMLGPYGWEKFSTAFIEGGRFCSASAEHCTSGVYRVKGGSFKMEGNLTQHVPRRVLFGEKNVKGLPIQFEGAIDEGTINGHARVEGREKYARPFRLNRLPVLN